MYEERIRKLKEFVVQSNIEAFFITNFYNVLYLTGFKTLSPHEREAYVLVTRKNTYVFSDGRYEIQYKNTKHTPFIPSREGSVGCVRESNIFKFKLLTAEMGLIKQLQKIVDDEQIKTIGFEGEDMRFSEYFLLRKTLPIKCIPFDRILLKQREIKEDHEIEKIKKACEIGDSCLTEIAPCIRPGISEKEIAWNIEKQLRISGYELSFDPIVAIDANSALPHYDTKSGNGLVKSDSIVLIDFGVKYQDYCSDISRMFFMKDVPGEIRNAYEILKKAQVATIKQIIVAKKLNEVDKYCREVIANCACLPARQGLRIADYPHSTGHGIGLEVHEYPKVSAQSSDVVCANQAFTIEPGIYVPGKWGMRVEDTVTINEKNEVKILTLFPIS